MLVINHCTEWSVHHRRLSVSRSLQLLIVYNLVVTSCFLFLSDLILLFVTVSQCSACMLHLVAPLNSSCVKLT